MITPDYEDEVLRTAGGLDESNSVYNGLLMPVLGLCGEAGEVAELVKKAAFHGHDLSYQHLAEELGDVLWYLTLAAWNTGYSLEDIMELNVQKLRKRYPNGFSEERSRNRED